MSKYFLISRIIILLALLFILSAVIWGWTHQSEATASGEANHLEKYNARKPGGGTTVFFMVSLIVGIGLVCLSIWLEWLRSRNSGGEAATGGSEDTVEGGSQFENRRPPLHEWDRLREPYFKDAGGYREAEPTGQPDGQEHLPPDGGVDGGISAV